MSWTGIRVLILSAKVPEMHVGFLPFIPKPVTKNATIYTSMLTFVKVFNRLDQEAPPLFCDEGDFKIVLDIYFPKKRIVILFQCLEFSHTKYVEHCIGKYTEGSCIEESLKQTQAFDVNVVDAVLNGTNYARSL